MSLASVCFKQTNVIPVLVTGTHLSTFMLLKICCVAAARTKNIDTRAEQWIPVTSTGTTAEGLVEAGIIPTEL